MKTKKKSKKQSSSNKENEKQHPQLHRSLNVRMKATRDGTSNKGILSQLQEKMKGSKFRWINEQLYTQSGNKSLQMIQEDESLFDIYHQGFREQVRRWPLVPVDVFIKMLKYVIMNSNIIIENFQEKKLGILVAVMEKYTKNVKIIMCIALIWYLKKIL